MDLKEKKFVEKTLKNYESKENGSTKFAELKLLDRKARRNANVFAYLFGSIGTLLLGIGMCICLGAILVDYFSLGIVVGVIGLLCVSINYFIYKKLLIKGKTKYAESIRKIGNELLQN